jgi:DNA-binding transcriptional MerR regulator
MKISQLVKRTGVPKETIHFYIREGLLRKPRKSGVNSAEYNETYVDQIKLIKDLRDNYYLPIPEIKKIVKDFRKQSPSDQAVSQFRSRFFRPADRLFTIEIKGRETFARRPVWARNGWPGRKTGACSRRTLSRTEMRSIRLMTLLSAN